MARPVILTVDDDINVLRSVERDLRNQYGSSYRVLRADSGSSALELVGQLEKRGDPTALFLVDQRMPQMSGVELLEKAVKVFPDAKRALLTAYADTDAAIKAINDVQIDYYLLKPWDPPTEKLYPVVDDLLDDWHAGYRPPFEGIKVVGNGWSPAGHDIKDFLARNNIPYLWLDPDIDDEAKSLMEKGDGATLRLPAVILEDGECLERPSLLELANQVGLQTEASGDFYDLAVIGAGPAGLAAAVYGASEGLKTLVIERSAAGGQAGMSSRIENYLGFPSGLSGQELARRAVAQARRFGVEILTAQDAVGFDASGKAKVIKLADGSEVSSRAVLVSTGVSYRTLDAPGIAELTGAGVYYGAAMTEGESVKGQDVYLVGGANSAGQAAMYFSYYASTVTMLVRGKSLSDTMSSYLIDQIAETPNIRVWTETELVEAQGQDRLKSLTLDRSGDNQEVQASALFIFIGATPFTGWLGDQVARDEYGFIPSGPDVTRLDQAWSLERQPYLLESSTPGVFVAGDVRKGSVKRVASAVGEGSAAVMFVHQYLSSE